MSAPLALCIADDHALFRQGVKSLLRRQVDLNVVAEADRVDDVEPALRRRPCDLLLLDVQMDRSALDAVPRFAALTKVLILTMSESVEDGVVAVQRGARGVVFKRFALTTLLEAIRTIAADQVWLPPSIQAGLVSGLHEAEPEPISAREREIVRQVALGRRNAEVARALFISEETVKKHLNTIFQKLGLRDRVQLTLYAIQSRIVSGFERPVRRPDDVADPASRVRAFPRKL